MSVFWPDAVASLIATARGHHEHARAHLDHTAAVGSAASFGSDWLMYASALATEAEGDLERAGATAEMIGDVIVASGVLALLLNGGPELVRLGLATGRTASAGSITAGLRTLTGRSCSPVAAALGAWAGGPLDGDAAPIASAAEILAGCSRAPEAARARHAAAVISARHGDHEEARRLAKQDFAA
jgi:hypothetical protein